MVLRRKSRASSAGRDISSVTPENNDDAAANLDGLVQPLVQNTWHMSRNALARIQVLKDKERLRIQHPWHGL